MQPGRYTELVGVRKQTRVAVAGGGRRIEYPEAEPIWCNVSPVSGGNRVRGSKDGEREFGAFSWVVLTMHHGAVERGDRLVIRDAVVEVENVTPPRRENLPTRILCTERKRGN